MTTPAGCRLLGRWRIVQADLWDRDYRDLDGPATITIGADNHGEIAFGAMQATLDLGYSPSMVFFTWVGCDEMERSRAMAMPNCSTTAPSRSHSPITTAMKHPQSHTGDFFNSLLGGQVRSPMYID